MNAASDLPKHFDVDESLQRASVDEEKADHRSFVVGTSTRAWLTVAGAWLLQFCAMGVIISFGVFQDFYSTVWLSTYSSSTISWIGSIQLFLELACAPIGGKLFDSGHFRLPVLFGSTLFVFSFFMLSLAHEQSFYQVFLSQGVGMGIGAGLIFLPTSTVVAQHFVAKRALAMGIVTSGGSLGGVLFSIMLNKLIRGSVGFTHGVRIAAFLMLGCLAVGNLLMRKPNDLDKSEGDENRDVKNPGGPEVFVTVEQPKRPFWDLSFTLILLAAFLASLGSYFPVYYVQQFADMHGIDENLSFYSIAILNASNMFGRIIPNYFADKLGTWIVFASLILLNGLLTFAMLACGSPGGLITFSILYGFSVGGVISVYMPLIAVISSGRDDIGRRIGVSLVPVGVAYLVGSPITALIIGGEFIWWKGVTFAAVTMIAAFFCLLVMKITMRPPQS